MGARHREQARNQGADTRERHTRRVPSGHRFTIEVEGIGDNKASERGEEFIAKRVAKAFRYSDSINVTHEGPIEWE